MNISQYNASQSLETVPNQKPRSHLSFPSSYKLHYEELIYKYEAKRNIEENINATCMGIRRGYINIVKYDLRKQDVYEQK